MRWSGRAALVSAAALAAMTIVGCGSSASNATGGASASGGGAASTSSAAASGAGTGSGSGSGECSQAPKGAVDTLLAGKGYEWSGGSNSGCEAVAKDSPNGERVTYWNLGKVRGSADYDKALGFIKAAQCNGGAGSSTPAVGDKAFLDASCYAMSKKMELIVAKGSDVYQVFYVGSLSLNVPQDRAEAAIVDIGKAIVP